MKKMTVVVSGLFVILAGVLPATGTLTFEERVEAQRAIERVYYSHRIWPESNPYPKPQFEQMVPEDLLLRKVEAYLLKSAALEEYWGRPLTGEQLQAEMDRMARDTRDASMLRELFAALDNDPFLIAECYVRPSLADRHLRDRYAFDPRFHQNALRAARDLFGVVNPANFALLGGEYYRPVHAHREGSATPAGTLALSGEELRRFKDRFPPPGRISGPDETGEAFILNLTQSVNDENFTGGVIAIPKIPFDAWFRDQVMGKLHPGTAEPRHPYHLPSIGAGFRDFTPESPDAWRPLWAIPSLRKQHTAVWTGAEMIIWGGTNGEALDSGGRYYPISDSWTWMPISGIGAPSPRYEHTAVWTGEEMIIWGGTDGMVKLRTGGRYNPTTDTWKATTTISAPASGRNRHTAIWTGIEMLIWGGDEGASFVKTGYRYHPANDDSGNPAWKAMNTMTANTPSARIWHTAVWTGTEMIVWGGNSGGYLDSGARYNPGLDNGLNDPWIAMPLGPSARYLHTAVWSGTEMIVWGGYTNSGVTNTGGRYNPSWSMWMNTCSDAWCNVPFSRARHIAVWTGSSMIIWGGDMGGTTTDRGAVYVPSNDSWTDTTWDVTTPAGRRDHTAVWTGSEMIVWGGEGAGMGTYFLDTGGRYNPSNGYWENTLPTPMPGLPTARVGHSMVWTGTEMIVWGGEAVEWGVQMVRSGARYYPSSDIWDLTDTWDFDTPSSRKEHTAVWSGTAMIVWGGTSGTGYMNDGALYDPDEDPMGDPWTPMITTNAPSGRHRHTAVWADGQLIVWGGFDGMNRLNTGGHYIPGTPDQWKATTISGAPTGRDLHTAIWTGAEMIIWGGLEENPGPLVQTGGHFLPGNVGNDTDFGSWSAMPTTNAPSARGSHTAVWTGNPLRSMIIWGGVTCTQPHFGCYDGATPLGDGRLYAVDAMQWSPNPLPSSGQDARYEHSAVWTGKDMLVWGGSKNTTYGSYGELLNDGAQYRPDFPVAEAWHHLTLTLAPSARSKAPSVWTGTGMIVWDGNPRSRTGGIYYPDTPPTAVIGAIYDPGLKAPICGTPGTICDSADTLFGRDSITGGPETNQPNTLGGTCADGTSGVYNTDESIDRIRILSRDGTALAPGDTVTVEVTFKAGSAIALDLFHCADALAPSPVWTLVGTFLLPAQTSPATATLALAAGPLQAVRARTRREANALPCAFGNYNDHDDLVFAVGMETVQAVYELGTAGSTLDLSALGSTSGSNAFSSPPYEDTWDTVTAYEWDLNGDAHFEWGCRSEGSWGVDRVGADQQLDDSDLEALGMAVPGNQPIWLRVTDEQGTKHCSRSLVTIADGVSPQATMFLPDGGESWPFSESDSKRRRQFIVWDADDDFYLAHSKLSYSCDGGSNWTCIAESAWRYANLRGGVPIPDAPYESTWASSNIFVDWGMSGELVADVNVLVNINHPNVGDLNLVLEHVLPGGTTKSVPLSIYNGASGDNYEGTLFDDEAGSAIEAGAAPFTGSFRPQAGATLSEFDGVSPAGSWTLKVMDPVSGNAGAIGTWALQIATDSVCGSQNYSATDTLEADDDFFVWDLPTQKEAAESIPGQTFPSANCRARVEVWDGAGHTASDDSDANFYIVQPTTTSVRTLVLWHPERMCALYDATPGCDCEDWGGTSCTVTQNLEEKLGELADHDKVEGVVLDLGNSTAVATAYAAWDASPTDQTLANAVAAAIRTYLYGANGQISKTYTKTENLILVGDDAILPFYRMADGTMTTDPFDPAQDYSEAKYAGAAPNHEVAIDTTTTVGSALAQGYFLTDNYYSESFPEDSGLDAPHDKIYQNDYATGRLVETPAQVATVIDAFLAYSGQVDVLSSADEVLVTGFDFVFDSARTIYDLYEDVNYSPWTTDALLDDPDDLDPLDAPFTPANLLDQLIPAASTDLHKISSVNTHANHFSWAASAAGSGSANLLCTDPSYDAAYCYQGEGLDGRAGNLNATILYTSGCHSGLPIPNGAAGSSPYALDLPEVMAKKGVLAYIGNTGYGWAIRNGVGLTEKLMELITEEILKNSSVEIGRALAQAKREYFLQENRYDVFDEKVMHQLTLYGIPSTLLLIKNARGAKETLPPMSDPRDGCADGICVKKEDGAAGLRALPDGITEKRLTFTFGSGTYALTETSNGDYYTLNGLASGETGDAIQPKFIYDSYLSGTTAHGVLFTGGAYGSENFTPLSAVPKSTNDPNAGAGPLPAIGGFTPTLQGTDTRSSTTTMRSGSDGDYLNMVTHTGYFDPAAGEENRFDEMQFTVYYHQDIAGQVKAYSGNPVLIPDGGTATASITVSTSGIAKLEKVVVKVSVAHDGVGDLTLTLVSPASTEVALCSGVGGTDDHYSDTVFDDGAATPIGSGTAPFTGYFRPANPLSALAGESADGTWTLRVADGGPNGTGQILAFSLVFGYTAPVITEPDAPAPYASAGATAIVAGTAVTSDLTVSGSGIACIEDIDVTVDITHPFTADLTLSLVAPDASEIVLAQGLGAGADYTDTVFDDEAAAAVTGGANPFTGSFRPEQPLSRYDCTPADGTWSLKVADGGAAGGSLESWSIEFGEGLHTLEGLTARFSVAASDTNDIYRVLVTYDDLSGTWNSLDLSKNATSGAWEGSLDLQNDILYYVQAVDKVGKVGKLTEAGTDANSAGTKYGSTWAYTRLMELNLRDFDGDSLPDAYEDQHACLDGGTPGQGALDPDYDGLTSLEEMALGTDPCLADSDGDGDNDGSEENNGKEPLSAGDGDRLLIAPFKAGGTGNVTIRWPRATDNGTPTGNPCSPVDPPACVAVGDNNAMDGHFRVYVSTDPRFSTDDTKVGPLVPIDTRETTLTDPGETVYFIVTNWDILIPAPLIEVVTRNASVFTLYGQHFHAAGSQALLCEAADACNSPVQMTVTSRTTTRIQATAPGGLSGTKYVAVENPDGLRDIYGVGYSFP